MDRPDPDAVANGAPALDRGLARPRQRAGDDVRGRLIAQFSALYLTLLSIIQGVALAYFAAELTAKASELTPSVWVQAAVTLLSIVLVWNEWAMTTLAFSWLPGFADAAIPFLFGVVELFQAYAMGPDATRWLGANVLLGAMGVASYAYAYRRAGAHPSNAALVRMYAARAWFVGTLVSIGIGATVFALAWSGRLDPRSAAGPVVLLVGSVVFVVARARQWERMLRVEAEAGDGEWAAR